MAGNSRIADRITALHNELDPGGVELVAVSKFHPAEKLLEAYQAGQRHFGESRQGELLAKIAELPYPDIVWHFIGHLQTNKVRSLVGKVGLFESIDSERLLRLIDSESERAGTVSKVLLQVHVAREETKTGFLPEEFIEFFRKRGFESLKATHICGIMGMASNCPDDPERIRSDFREIKRLHSLAMEMCPDLRGFDIVSMGMSDDYITAIAEGSNHVRIGSDIFGQREY